MTSLDVVNEMMDLLEKKSINYITVFRGWNKDGASGSTPYKIKYNTKSGSTGQYKKLIEKANRSGNTIYFYNDYVKSYSKGISNNSDVALSNLMLKMNYEDGSKVLFNDYSYLYPESSLKYANKNIKQYQKLKIDSLALDSIGYMLYTYNYKKTNYSREYASNIYSQILDKLNDSFKLALFTPNNYLYKYTVDYLDAKVYSNSYQMYTDNVPFIPYVLKGYVDLYGEYLNFNAIGTDMYLRYLDYGIFPSYILTEVISSKLKYTDSYFYYTTQVNDFKDEIIDVYNTYKVGYNATLNSTVEARVVPSLGVSVIVYKNMNDNSYKTLVINYNVDDYDYLGHNVSAKSYIVLEGAVL